MKKFVLTFTLLLFSICFLFAKQTTYYIIDLKKEIGSTTWLYVKNGIAEAHKENADAIIIHMNTYGGAVV
ncbi:MAG: NfeD family protein, partial [Bacteroidales bacterium]